MAALVDSAQLGPRPSRLPTHAWATPVVASAEPPSLAPVREAPLSADEHAKLNDVERAGVCSYFVEGAPATITRNIETADGLVNSCDAALHSLTLPDGFDFSEHMARRAVVRDGVTEVELEAPPRSINVVPSVSAEARAALLARAASPTARPSRTASRVAARNE